MTPPFDEPRDGRWFVVVDGDRGRAQLYQRDDARCKRDGEMYQDIAPDLFEYDGPPLRWYPMNELVTPGPGPADWSSLFDRAGDAGEPAAVVHARALGDVMALHRPRWYDVKRYETNDVRAAVQHWCNICKNGRGPYCMTLGILRTALGLP